MRVFLLCVVISTVGAYTSFMSNMPNGHNVPSPCGGTSWPGVGHLRPQGGGARNQFGVDFNLKGNGWLPAICQMDSDGDGLTNGQELGDPECVWKTGATPNRTTDITHPGICEPLASSNCSAQPVPQGRYANQSDWIQHVCGVSTTETVERTTIGGSSGNPTAATTKTGTTIAAGSTETGTALAAATTTVVKSTTTVGGGSSGSSGSSVAAVITKESIALALASCLLFGSLL